MASEVARYPRVSSGKHMLWSFFGARPWQRRAQWDGNVVKRWRERWLWHYQLQRLRVPLDNVADMVGFKPRANLQVGVHSTFERGTTHRRLLNESSTICMAIGQVDRGEDFACDTLVGTGNCIVHILRSHWWITYFFALGH